MRCTPWYAHAVLDLQSINESALVQLGAELKRRGYSFVTPTPATHARVNARATAQRALTLRDVFGWSRPFAERSVVGDEIAALMQAAGVLRETGTGFQSLVRCSSLGADLFFHSAFPTAHEHAVFFGPDTYRFATFLRQHAPLGRVVRAVDVGCGTGAGGIVLARTLGTLLGELILADVNQHALALARVNAQIADVRAHVVESDVLKSITDDVDLVVSNPPYILDENQRKYRDGGGDLGSELSLRIAREAGERLKEGGTLLLYTGVAVANGVDHFQEKVVPHLTQLGAVVKYEENDPDVFGEEMSEPAYVTADRIAVVGVTATFSERDRKNGTRAKGGS